MKSKVLMIIKKMFFEFIIIIFLIGFFSSSFANYTVPKVNSALAYSGSIEKSFPIEGQVEYKQIHKVRLGYNVIIEENFVDVGKRVRQDDPIFRVNGNYGINHINKQFSLLEIELEKEKNKIQSLKGSNYLIDEKKLDLQRKNLQKEEKSLLKFKKLYEEGAIPLDELEEYEYKVEALKANLYIEELKYQDTQRDNELNIEETYRRIAEINKDMDGIKKRNDFYSKVGEDGIYYSDVSGVVLKNSNINQILSPDETVVEIAIEGDKVVDYIFSGYISEDDGRSFMVGDILNVELNNQQQEIRFKIEHMYFVEEKGSYKIEGELMREMPPGVLLHRNYKGKIKKGQTEDYIIPKAAIITPELVEGGKGIVYIIETTEGILGSQHIAKQVEVEIIGVGDKVGVGGLEEFENVRVITNLSHKIKDGVKVSHGF